MGTVENIRRVPVMEHIVYRVRKLEKACDGVVCLQFADHPEGLLMIIRIYVPASEKEFTYPDVVSPIEFCNSSNQNERIDILFDLIHEALEKVQPISSMSGGLIHH